LNGGSAGRKAATYTQNNTNTKYTQISMPSVGFEPTIPAFERAKTVHAFYHAATVIGTLTQCPELRNYLSNKGTICELSAFLTN
jgi:hypothetical protein